MSRASARIIVSEPRQVRALAGHLQQQIVATLERSGACSANELAAHLGVAPESLYYHLRKLTAVGLLVVRERRPTRRRPETVFSLRGSELVLDPQSRQPAFLEALVALQRSLMAMAVRLYARAIQRRAGVRSGARRNLCVIQQHARLRPKDLAELNGRLEETARFVAEHDDPTLESFVSLTITMSPVTRA